MNKKGLIAKVAKQTHTTQAQAACVVNTMLEIISDTMAKDDYVLLMGFGKFYARKRKAQINRNPRTLQRMDIAAHKVPAFTASGELRRVIAEDDSRPGKEQKRRGRPRAAIELYKQKTGPAKEIKEMAV